METSCRSNGKIPGIVIGVIVLMLVPHVGSAEGTFSIVFSPHKFVVDMDNEFWCIALDAVTRENIEGAQVDVTGPDFSFSGVTGYLGKFEYPSPVHPLLAGLVSIDITHADYTPYHTKILAQAGTGDAEIIDCFGEEGMLPSWDINRNGIWDGPAIDCWPFDSPYLEIDTGC